MNLKKIPALFHLQYFKVRATFTNIGQDTNAPEVLNNVWTV